MGSGQIHLIIIRTDCINITNNESFLDHIYHNIDVFINIMVYLGNERQSLIRSTSISV